MPKVHAIALPHTEENAASAEGHWAAQHRLTVDKPPVKPVPAE